MGLSYKKWFKGIAVKTAFQKGVKIKFNEVFKFSSISFKSFGISFKKYSIQDLIEIISFSLKLFPKYSILSLSVSTSLIF